MEKKIFLFLQMKKIFFWKKTKKKKKIFLQMKKIFFWKKKISFF